MEEGGYGKRGGETVLPSFLVVKVSRNYIAKFHPVLLTLTFFSILETLFFVGWVYQPPKKTFLSNVYKESDIEIFFVHL